MPLTSPHAVLLAKWLAIDMQSLRDLNKSHPDEAIELISRIRAFVKQMRPDLFQPNEPKEPQP